jgi:dTDP-4-dehydrorhamnose 3,5-epimerase
VVIEFDIEESTVISGVYILTPSISKDIRGNIWTSFLKDEIEKLLPDGLHFKHDKFSTSKCNVLRGIHGDKKSWKLVTCVHGEIQQVVVDCRKDSPTYKQWQDFIINQDNQQLILIPPNMGNAYYVNSQNAVYHYKLAYNGDYIDANEQFSLSWNDDSIGINWMSNNPVLSNRDIVKEHNEH